MATVYVGSARSDENGKAHGGQAGDQKNGKEVSTQKWYLHSKGWRVFRAKKAENAETIAKVMKWACDDNKIGYDQYQRHTLYKELAKNNFTSMSLSKAVETDCSALVRVCLAFCGIDVPEAFRTGNMPSYLLNSGEFVEMKGNKYTNQSDYLGAGDILVTKTNGHTVVVINNGSKYEGATTTPTETKRVLGSRLLKKGMSGDDVKELQSALIALGYDCGKYGADGDFGSGTLAAVRAFQKDCGLTVDGEFGSKSYAALVEKQQNSVKKIVEIVGGNCNVRAQGNTSGSILGVAHKGETYEYAGETNSAGWNKINFNGKTGWVSGKYSSVK